ncbi:MAG: class C sortase [Clostridiales bacterium]|nr:class C sortase [Clostridiales bacterium]
MERWYRGFGILKLKYGRLPAFGFLLAGIALLVYPWVSNYVYENRARSQISAYEDEIAAIDTEESSAILFSAQKFNERIYADQLGASMLSDPFAEPQDDAESAGELNPLAQISSSGVMGYIDIPEISVYLPVFDGTDASTLMAGIGLLEGSSLPVGGEDTHAVLTGHTGLSSARMFTDLTELKEGDVFYFHILGETLAYEVMEITIAEPSDTSALRVRSGKDLMTLVTCTPYGVNSHRLYVTGERAVYLMEVYERQKDTVKAADLAWVGEYRKAVLLGLLCVATAVIIITNYKRRR